MNDSIKLNSNRTPVDDKLSTNSEVRNYKKTIESSRLIENSDKRSVDKSIDLKLLDKSIDLKTSDKSINNNDNKKDMHNQDVEENKNSNKLNQLQNKKILFKPIPIIKNMIITHEETQTYVKKINNASTTFMSTNPSSTSSANKSNSRNSNKIDLHPREKSAPKNVSSKSIKINSKK
jgi:hypothetical protein